MFFEFGIGFKVFRDNEKGSSLFPNPFAADIDNSPTELQLELIGFQNNSDTKNAH